MSAPTTPGEFLDLVAKSGVVAATLLDRYRRHSGGNARALARAMVRDGLLTPLQSGLLLRGRCEHTFLDGKYRLLEHLGSGSTGCVYLCEHVVMGRRVALRALRAGHEAQRARALDHDHVVCVYDVEQEGLQQFLVMEYVDGIDLKRLVRNAGPLPVSRAVNLIIQAATGLQYAHDVGMRHGALRPGKILVDRWGTVKIADFTREKSGSTGGDVRALAATLYYLLCGQDPGSAQLTELRPDVPPRLAALIDNVAGAKDDEHCPTAAEFAAALARWDEGRVVPPAGEMPPRAMMMPAAVGSGSGQRSQRRVVRRTEPRGLARVQTALFLGGVFIALLSAAAVVFAAH